MTSTAVGCQLLFNIKKIEGCDYFYDDFEVVLKE